MGFRIAYQDREPIPRRSGKKVADYLAFLHTLPCCVTGKHGVEAAHVSFASPWHGHYGRGRQSKAPDRFALPLCPEAHRDQHATNERAWWAARGIDPHDLANALWGIYSDGDDNATELCKARILSGLAAAGRLPTREDA